MFLDYGIRFHGFGRRLNEKICDWGTPTGSMSPFAFFCAPPAAIRLDASLNALFICVAFPLRAESLFDGPVKLVAVALSGTRFAPEVRPDATSAPGNTRLFWVVVPLVGNGMGNKPVEVGEEAEEWLTLRSYGPVAAGRFKAVSVNWGMRRPSWRALMTIRSPFMIPNLDSEWVSFSYELTCIQLAFIASKRDSLLLYRAVTPRPGLAWREGACMESVLESVL